MPTPSPKLNSGIRGAVPRVRALAIFPSTFEGSSWVLRCLVSDHEAIDICFGPTLWASLKNKTTDHGTTDNGTTEQKSGIKPDPLPAKQRRARGPAWNRIDLDPANAVHRAVLDAKKETFPTGRRGSWALRSFARERALGEREVAEFVELYRAEHKRDLTRKFKAARKAAAKISGRSQPEGVNRKSASAAEARHVASADRG